MGKPIYVCHQCHMPIRSDEATRVDDGKFFHTHRDCHGQYVLEKTRVDMDKVRDEARWENYTSS